MNNVSTPAATLHPDDEAAIEAFLERLWSEQGLADNTLASYRRDLRRIGALAGCARAPSGQLRARAVAGLSGRAFQAWRHSGKGYSARSNARLLSAMRHFYRLRLRMGAIAHDPTLLLDAPKLPRPLPKALVGGRSRGTDNRAGRGNAAGIARSRDVRADLRDRPAGQRTGRPAHRTGESAPGRAARDRQGRQGAPRAARRAGPGLAGALLRRCAPGAAARARRRRGIRDQPPRRR